MKWKSVYNLLVVTFLVSLLISACGSAATPTATPEIPITGPATATTAPATATEPPATATPTSTSVPPTPTESSQSAANEPVGVYRVRLAVNAPLGVSAGYYRVTLNADGSYTIGWAPTQAQEGLVGVNGIYTIDGDQIVFTDVKGFAVCTAEDGVSGTYQWSLSSQGLTLTPIDDTCEVRVYVLSTKPLPRD